MGYFSDLAMELDEEDWSYPTPERQLMWRYEDLCSRLLELTESGACYRSNYFLYPSDTRYILPEHLCTVGEVETAILLAKEVLKTYGILVDEVEPSEAEETVDTPCEGQISWDNGNIYTFIECPKAA